MEMERMDIPAVERILVLKSIDILWCLSSDMKEVKEEGNLNEGE